jgi:hypothetical protein
MGHEAAGRVVSSRAVERSVFERSLAGNNLETASLK